MSAMNDRERYYQEQMRALQNSTIGDYYNSQPSKPFTLDVKSLSTEQIELMLARLQAEYDLRTRHTPLEGPTRAELEADETLRGAWEEYSSIRRLKGLK